MITRRIFLSSLMAAATPSLPVAQEIPQDGWTRADPASAGLDPEALAELVAAIDAGVNFPNVHALLIAHQERLVFEQYWPGEDGEYGYVAHGPTTLHDIRSISKSVTSLLLGIALGPAPDEALARPLRDFFPDRDSPSGALDAVTLHHALTMTAGLAWNETIVPYDSNNDFVRLLIGDDPVGFVLAKDLSDTPGSRWTYNSGLTDLVAAVIEHLTRAPLIPYADEVLFGPLGITEYEWWRPPAWPPDSFPSAAAGLRMRARDLAKIASLVLQDGAWQGRQIVPRDWIRRATTSHVQKPQFERYGYGYFWYPGTLLSGQQVIRASGYGDQRIFVLPEAGLAITILAGNYQDGGGVIGARIVNRIIRAMD